jgi:1-acyl-sn-glycerol-3-phosphate acyltransferase
VRHLRAILRIILLVTFSLVILLARLAVWPAALVSRKADRRLRRVLLRFWALVFAFISGVHVRTEGPKPKAPFFLVMNHVTYFDMLVLARETGCIFVSREDVQHWPLFGFVAKSLYIIFIDRALKRDTVRVNSLIRETVLEGDGIGIFAESHVSCGLTVEPFKSPLLQSAIDLGMPVHYAALNYRTPEGSPLEGEIVSWWRPEPFYVHLYRFLKYPGVTATLRFCDTPLFDEDRKSLARRLHAGVLAKFTPLRQAAVVYAESRFPIEVPEPAGRCRGDFREPFAREDVSVE